MKISVKGRIAFANGLWEASVVPGSDSKPKFSASLLIPHGDPQIKKINDAIDETAKEKWGAKAAAIVKSARATDKVCLHDGDNKSQYEGFPGNMYVSASNAVRPMVVNRDKSPLTEADGVIYSGCTVIMILELWAQDNTYGKRVNASLAGVQFVADGDSFGGGARVASDDDFEDLGEGTDAEGDLG